MNTQALPSARSLIREGVDYIKDRSDLVIWLFVPTMVFAISEYLVVKELLVSDSSYAVLGLVTLVAVIFNFLLLAATLFIVTQSSTERISMKQGLVWARQNIFSLIWIYILSALVILGGFLLLIIPGILLSIYVYFAQYVYVYEGKRGIATLVRSHELVKGYWWKLFVLSFKITLLIFVFFFILGAVLGLITHAGGGTAGLFSELILQLFSAALTVFGFVFGNKLYLIIRQAKETTEVTTASVPRWHYTALAWIGVAAIGVMVGGAIWLMSVYGDNIDWENIDYDTTFNDYDAKAELNQLRYAE